MKLEIDEHTLQYIKENGSMIHIDFNISRSCWVKLPVPKVRFGKPKIFNEFDAYPIDSIIVYIHKLIEPSKEVLTIKLDQFLWNKSISIYGYKL